MSARWWVAVGALSLSLAPVLIDLSGTDAATASFYRCLLALPFLLPVVLPEYRREGLPGRRQYAYGLAAGVCFAGDMVLWTQAIREVGAGLSTVLVNIQVVLVPLLAWLVDREPVPRRFLFWLPVLVAGTALTGGLVDSGTSGSDPQAGTVHAVLAALCYSGFLFLLRKGGFQGHVKVTYMLVVVTAAAVSALAGVVHYGLDFAPGLPAVALLALAAVSSGVIGWLLVAIHSPHLASHVGAVLLLLTPVGALGLGVAVLGERPTALQLVGCALILAAAYFTVGRRGRPSRAAADSGSARRVPAG
ncbi:DMT family transporter [Streptomyces monticola]|uniref:DMT family transporter n=1 Tax=Streptomyces monticola TaxID=2666263 RepID=A0ABW2J9E8_9ACTN